jgi:nucleoside triphosphate diphosphatase
VTEQMSSDDRQALTEEIGDLLFAVVNVARKCGIDSEAALRSGNAKFIRRFQAMETLATTRGQAFAKLDLEAQDALWTEIKLR